MMHCTMDDLLALAAGEGSAWARQHVTGCAACGAELEALHQRVAQLKALPPRRPARDRWPAVRDAVLAQRRRRRECWGLSGLAAAAALAGLLVFRPFWTKPVDAAELARVKQQSATLEQQLGRFDPDGRVTSGSSAALAAALEDRIAVVDGELARLGPSRAQARPADLVTLWQQRVDLMQHLVSVRVARAAYVGL
jgi:AcrR family transcriptional regulator